MPYRRGDRMAAASHTKYRPLHQMPGRTTSPPGDFSNCTTGVNDREQSTHSHAVRSRQSGRPQNNNDHGVKPPVNTGSGPNAEIEIGVVGNWADANHRNVNFRQRHGMTSNSRNNEVPMQPLDNRWREPPPHSSKR